MNGSNDIRCKQLSALGLVFIGSEYVKDDFNVHWTEITCSSDAEFEKIISNIKKEMERRNALQK